MTCKSISKLSRTMARLFNNPIDPLSRHRALTTQIYLLVSTHDPFPGLSRTLLFYSTCSKKLFRDELVTYYTIYKPTASQDRSFLHRKFGDIVEKATKKLEIDKTRPLLFKHISDETAYLKSKNLKR